jgi:hypothetical protein
MTELNDWERESWESESKWADHYFKMCQYFDNACLLYIGAVTLPELTSKEKEEILALFCTTINEIRAKI